VDWILFEITLAAIQKESHQLVEKEVTKLCRNSLYIDLHLGDIYNARRLVTKTSDGLSFFAS